MGGHEVDGASRFLCLCTRPVSQLSGGASASTAPFINCFLHFPSQRAQVLGKLCEEFSLPLFGCKVTDQRAVDSVGPELFHVGFQVVHTPCSDWRLSGWSRNMPSKLGPGYCPLRRWPHSSFRLTSRDRRLPFG